MSQSSRSFVEKIAANLPLPDLIDQGVTVAFSGGRDSVALLAALFELSQQHSFLITALHVNHHLSVFTDDWQQFCEQFCEARNIPLLVKNLYLQREGGDSLEALARAGRYQAFADAPARYVALAQHQDDQAETFLLQAIRGAGPAGLAGMPKQRAFQGKQLLRPLLDISRAEIEHWLQSQSLSWIDDESNADVRFRRNAIRHQILPVLEKLHPGSKSALARSSAHCGETIALLQELAEMDGDPSAACLPVSVLAALSYPRAKNLLRTWLQKRGAVLPATHFLDNLLTQILTARHDAQPEFQWDNAAVRRFDDQLYWVSTWQPPQTAALVWRGERELRVSGWCGKFIFEPAANGLAVERLQGQLLQLKPRSGGEKIELSRQRPRQLLKNLFQQSAIPPWERERWPLLYAEDELVVVPGIAAAVSWQAAPGVSLRWQPE